MKENITNTIKDKYYRYNPGEFLPVYVDGQLANRSDFHRYRIKQLVTRPSATIHYFTHFSG